MYWGAFFACEILVLVPHEYIGTGGSAPSGGPSAGGGPWDDATRRA